MVLGYGSSRKYIQLDLEVYEQPQGLESFYLPTLFPSYWFYYQPPHGSKIVADTCRLDVHPRSSTKEKILPLFFNISTNVQLHLSGFDWGMHPLKPVYLVTDVRLELRVPPLELDIVHCDGRECSS